METLIVTGGSGYIGSRLLKALDKNAFRIIALVRPGSEHKIPPGIEIISADVFNPEEWIYRVPGKSIFIHLLGVSHPNPSKSQLFERIDLGALKIVARVAKECNALKIIYLSVAMEPSSLMKDFQAAKRKAEQYIIAQNLSHVFVRPWYVLGPGHWWPYLLWPLFKLLEVLPATAKQSKAFAFVTIRQMITSLVYIITHLDEAPEVIEISDLIKISETGSY